MITADDLVECEGCRHHEFTPRETLTFHKNIRAREFDLAKPLSHLDKTIDYVCTNCGLKLDR